MNRATPLLAALLLAPACASSPGVRDRTAEVAESRGAEETSPAATPAPRAAPAPAQQTFNPKALAATFPQPAECEQSAREMKARAPEHAWALLRECVNRGFSSIKRLTDGGWDQDLQTRKDAGLVLAKVIAARGGEIEGDLAAIRKRRIPLFSLGAVWEQPQTYTGHLVVLRARMDEFKTEAGRPVALASETSLGSITSQVRNNNSYVSESSGSRSSSYGASKGSSRYEYTSFSQKHENTVRETGRECLLRLAKPDPFLEASKEFVILARFDGLRVTGEDELETKIALLTVVGYFEPSALVFE